MLLHQHNTKVVHCSIKQDFQWFSIKYQACSCSMLYGRDCRPIERFLHLICWLEEQSHKVKLIPHLDFPPKTEQLYCYNWKTEKGNLHQCFSVQDWHCIHLLRQSSWPSTAVPMRLDKKTNTRSQKVFPLCIYRKSSDTC